MYQKYKYNKWRTGKKFHLASSTYFFAKNLFLSALSGEFAGTPSIWRRNPCTKERKRKRGRGAQRQATKRGAKKGTRNVRRTQEPWHRNVKEWYPKGTSIGVTVFCTNRIDDVRLICFKGYRGVNIAANCAPIVSSAREYRAGPPC